MSLLGFDAIGRLALGQNPTSLKGTAVSNKFDHMLYTRVPKSWVAPLEAAAKSQGINSSQYVRECIAQCLTQDGFSPNAPKEFALTCDGEIVAPNVPHHIKHLCGTAILAFVPVPVEEGYEWWPVETEGAPNGATMPRYRVADGKVIRFYGEAA